MTWPDTYRAEIFPVVYIKGESSPVLIGAVSSPTAHALYPLPPEIALLARVRRPSVTLSGKTEGICAQKAIQVATAEGFTGTWSVGSAAVLPNHMYINEAWHTPTSGQFGFGFPVVEQTSPTSPPLPVEQTIVVQTATGPASLVVTFVVMVQQTQGI